MLIQRMPIVVDAHAAAVLAMLVWCTIGSCEEEEVLHMRQPFRHQK